MTPTPFTAMLWKECRAMRGYWLSLLAVFVAIQGLALWAYSLEPNTARHEAPLLAALLGSAAMAAFFYALGSSAAAFAVEKEEKTYEFLRALPIDAATVSGPKFLGTLVGSIMLFAALALSAAVWTVAAEYAGANEPWRLWDATETRPSRLSWVVGGAASAIGALVAIVLVGSIFSMLLQRAVTAAVATTVGLIVLLYASAFIAMVLTTTPAPWPERVLAGAASIGLLLAPLLGNVWLLRRWWNTPRPRANWRSAARGLSIDASPVDRRVPSLAGMRRLVWQHMRLSWPTMIAIALVGYAIVLSWLASDSQWHESQLILLGGVVVLCSALWGATLFLSDQSTAQYRFFAEQAVAPRKVWGARQLLGVATVAILVVLPLGTVTVDCLRHTADRLASDGRFYGSPGLASATAITYFVAVAALAYSLGQFCSIAFSSGIVAAFFGVILAFVGFAWAVAMAAVGASPILTVAPLAALFLFATWLRAPGWIHERNGWRSRTRFALTAIVPAAAFIAMVAIGRAYSIPWVDPGVPSAAAWNHRGNAGDLLDDYQVVATEITAAPALVESFDDDHAHPRASAEADAEWATANAASVEKLIDLSRRPVDGAVRWNGYGKSSFEQNAVLIGRLLLASAREREDAGDPAGAWQRYEALLHFADQLPALGDVVGWRRFQSEAYERLPEWILAEGQTPELLASASKALGSLESTVAAWQTRRGQEYDYYRRFLEADSPDVYQAAAVPWWTIAVVRSWEGERLLRLLNQWTALQGDATQQVVEALNEGQDARVTLKQVWLSPAFQRVAVWASSTHWFPFGHHASDRTAFPELQLFINTVAERRVGQALMAIEAWRLEQGELPASFDELVEKSALPVPMNPSAGQPFVYFPAGYPTTIQDSQGRRLAAGQPFLYVPAADSGGLLDESGLEINDWTPAAGTTLVTGRVYPLVSE